MINLLTYRLFVLFSFFYFLNFFTTVALAQSCSGGSLRVGNPARVCNPPTCVESKGNCTSCYWNCGALPLEYCSDQGNCSSCVNVQASANCGGGRCRWNNSTSCSNSCSGGFYCNGTPITGSHGQTGVCGGGNINYGCNNGTWYSQGTFCILCATPVINTNSIGAYPGLAANIGWNAVTNATYYALRVNDSTVSGWNGTCSSGDANGGNFCANIGTSYSWTALPGHSYTWWVHSCNGGTCSNSSSASFTAPSAPTSTPTPTPTPTPSPTPTPTPVIFSYYKLKDTSFYKIGSLSQNFPPTIGAYDGSDTSTGGYFNQGNAGAVISSGSTLSAGTGGTAISGSSGSARNWTALNYSGGNSFTSSSFINYVRAKKSTTAAATTAAMTTSGRTYSLPANTSLSISSTPAFTDYVTVIVDGDLTLSVNDLGKNGVTFIVDGDVFINGASGNFNAANRPLAVISTGTINFAAALTEADGLFVGRDVSFGSGSTPLKIVGNVSSANVASHTRDRATNQPSMFIVFDPSHMMNIVDKISTVKSSWTQLQ